MNDENGLPQKIEPLSPVKQIYRDLVDCLTEPRRFFTDRYPQITFTYALAFGIIVNWLASFLEWLTRMVRHETLLDGLLKMRDQLQQLPFWKSLPADIWAQNPEHLSMFPAWLAEVFGVALSPFNTLLRFLISGLVLWVGASVLVPKNPAPVVNVDPLFPNVPADRDFVNITNTIKIVALASVPNLIGAILGFLPLGLGTFIAGIYSFAILILAISIRFRVSYLRSFAIVVLPGIVGMFVFACVIGVFLALIFGTIAALFQVH